MARPVKPRKAPLSAPVLAFAMLAAGALSACGLGDFDSQTKVNSVRLLATRADKPFAKPGETVNLEVLAYDGRRDQTRPMKVWWIPQTCFNPPNDAYYACFAALESGAVGGAGGVGLRPGMDLSPFLLEGTSFAFTVPADIIDTHPPVAGTPPYGLAIAFTVACTGHLELLEPDPNNASPQQMPVGCFDDAHNRLGPDDFVIGYTRTYVYNDRTNSNPVLDGILIDGQPVDPAVGVTLPRCTADKRASCQEHKINILVPESSQEPNPGDVGEGGENRKEEIWATFFSTLGDFNSEAALLYDPNRGKITDYDSKYRAPNDPGDGLLWIIVRDNRGGAVWAQIPVHVQ
jgi:hypothetical protein